VNRFNYEELIQNALMDVVRAVLTDVSINGLCDNHHFYIKFRTDHPKTKIPSYLKQHHPEEITIVIQHQFWNLQIAKEYFSLDLSFNNIREKLLIPYGAMTAFIDPSVNFALQFTPSFDEDTPKDDKSDDGDETNAPSISEDGKIISFDSFRKK
jgi:hypothetical protein